MKFRLHFSLAKFHVAKTDPLTIISFLLMLLSGIQEYWPVLQPIVSKWPKTAAGIVFAISLATFILRWFGKSLAEKAQAKAAVDPVKQMTVAVETQSTTRP